MPEFANIIFEVEKKKARIILNRPEKLNALSQDMQREIGEALMEADRDDRVHVVILKGAGRAFCAGYDLSRPANATPAYGDVAEAGDGDNSHPRYRKGRPSFDDDTWMMEQAQKLRMILFDMHKPVIVQAHGHCLAGANDIAFLADIVIAAEDANIGFPAARANGVLPNQMWLYHMGPQWTKRLVLTGDTISGADAARVGLVLKAVPAALLEQEVEQLADRMCNIDHALLAANKRVVNLGLELMGARTLQRLAVEADARAHLATANATFNRISREEGLRAALTWRDTPFGDGRALVSAPELRDANGRLREGG